MRVRIEKLDDFGRGICFVEGKICFVENTLPNESVNIEIIKNTKKYLIGKALEFYQLSDDRVEEMCPYVFGCGGCNLRHMSFNCENKFKTDKVKAIMKKFAEIDAGLVKKIECVDSSLYRNKVVLHGNGDIVGYYEALSNKIIKIEECLLASTRVNEVISILNKMVLTNKILKVLIRGSNDDSKIMVSISGKINDYSLLEAKVDSLIINDKVILGDSCIISDIGDKKYYVSSESFFQINNKLTKKLYDEVLLVVKNVKPKRVLDLYCGTGTIGIYISDGVMDIVGVDCSKSNIEDAIRNNELNNCNVKFVCDKVENVIDKFDNIDLVIVDPPRSGLDKKTIDNLSRIKAQNIVYVSCDPITLARDLKMLSAYNVNFIKPFNMFPRTYHVECVCLLKLC